MTIQQEETPVFFEQQEASRKKVVPGDIFSIKIPDGYLLGRVIATDARSSEWDEPHLHLIYIYNGLRENPINFKPEDFRPPSLLIPPVLTNHLAWSRGYYKTIGHLPLSEEDVLVQHAFREPGTNKLWNEEARPVDESSVQDASIIGVQAVQSYLTTENRVSLALGLGSTI